MSHFSILLMVIQLSTKKYHPAIYWVAIVSTSTAGTTISDYMDRTLDLGYALGSLFLVSLLAAVLAVWRCREGTLSVNNIRTTKAKTFYWIAIVCIEGSCPDSKQIRLTSTCESNIRDLIGVTTAASPGSLDAALTYDLPNYECAER